MRMEYTGLRRQYNDKEFVDRVFNNRASRTMRPAWRMLNWHSKFKGRSKTECQTLTKLSARQIQSNSTRGSTPGLTDPNLPEGPNNIRVPLPEMKGSTGRLAGSKKDALQQANQQLSISRTGYPLPGVTFAPNATSNSLASPASGTRRSAGRPRSLTVAKPRRRRGQEATHADDHDKDVVASQVPMRRDPAPQAYHPYQQGQRPPSLWRRNASLGERGALAVPSDPFAASERDLIDASVPTALQSSIRYGMRNNQASYTSPYTGVYTAPPTSNPMLSQPASFGPFEGPHGHIPAHTRPMSPSICFDCGRLDPEAMHITHGCPTTDEPAVGLPLHQTPASFGHDRCSDPGFDTLQDQMETSEESIDEASVGTPLHNLFECPADRQCDRSPPATPWITIPLCRHNMSERSRTHPFLVPQIRIRRGEADMAKDRVKVPLWVTGFGYTD